MPTAVVTGANRGIGLGLAQALNARGYDVIGTARAGNDAAALSAVAKVVTLDVTDADSVAALGQAVDNVDLLINNAGTNTEDAEQSGPLASLTSDALLKVLAVNAVGPTMVTQALAPKLTAGAKVVNISSGMGSLGETSGQALVGYSVSKAALNMFTRQLSFDPAMKGRIVISMCPGWVQTRMGGAGASLTVEESAAGIVSVVEGLKPSDTGSFRRYNGDHPVW